MVDTKPEPSMEEILASIRRIIADEAEPPVADATPAAAPRDEPVAVADDVLELTNAIAPEAAATPVTPVAPLVSNDAATASRDKLAALSEILVRAPSASDNTLEGLVREMLRPMLKDWLDQRLPMLVEHLVEKEIARITGRSL